MGRLLSVVLVTWNSARYLPRCLAGIAGQTWPDVELIAVDNASADDSGAHLGGAGARCITNAENRGFSAAVNQALGVARGEFVLLVNPDAYLEPGYAQRIIEALDTCAKEFGFAAGTLFRATGDHIEPTTLIDSKGIRMTRSGRHLDIGQGLPDGADDRGLHPLTGGLWEVFGVSGAAALFRRSLLDDVAVNGEVFDEDFFAFREDADLAWRARLFGWRALHVPGAVAYHVRSVTPGRRGALSPAINMHSVKNRFLLRMKNEAWFLALRNAPFELARDLMVVIAALTIERTSLRGLRWVWKNRRHVMEKRRAIQRRRRVSDRTLALWFA